MSTSTSPPSTNGAESKPLLDPSNFPQILEKEDLRVSLTYNALPISDVLSFVRSPLAGANVLFLGTTRNNFDNRPVTKLAYSAYPALALKSFLRIAEQVKSKHQLTRVCLVHRLGEVPIEEESIAVCVSAGHRGPAWRGAEEALELCKERVEVWKMEYFGDGEGPVNEAQEGLWRANRDRDREGRTIGGAK